MTVRADLLDEAKTLELNASQAAEAGIEAAVKKAKEQAWLEVQIPAHCGQRFRRIADNVPVIADSRR